MTFAYPSLALPPAVTRYKLVDLAEHVPGEPNRYRHGWIPIGPISAIEKESVKYGSAKRFQSHAQAVAENKFYDGQDALGVRPVSFAFDSEAALSYPEGSPERGWGMYQVSYYSQINNYLRTGDAVGSPGGWTGFADPKTEAESLIKAFDTMGVTTDKPYVFYRGLSNQGAHDWGKEIVVGQTYVDHGASSTCADPDDVAGFLTDWNQATDPKDNVILEIHVPTGTRVLGGSTVGSETILKPGTKFRVLRKSWITAGGDRLKNYAPEAAYVKYVVEVVP